MKKRQTEERSKFFSLESHFLNTFHSGVYLSQGELILIAEACGIKLEMSSRELLLKKLFNEADESGQLQNVSSKLAQAIDKRIEQLHRLGLEHPEAREPLTRLIQKSNGSKSMLAREAKGNPYA